MSSPSSEVEVLKRRILELEAKLEQSQSVGITQGAPPSYDRPHHWTLPASERDAEPVSGGPLDGITVSDMHV